MRFFLLMTLLLFLSCASRKTTPDYITLLDNTTAKFNKELLQEHQLVCRGYGGRLMEDISEVTQHYILRKKCDVNTARRIAIPCIEKLVTMINADKKLHPFLHQYPFPANRINFTISFVDKDGNDYKDGSVAYITIFDGRIFYAKYNPESDALEDIWKEGYADALRIVQSETHNR